ncbi:MAG TPA: hypothetical protein VK929_04540 [Longimicrobiales bacterium]|nr:hypothetical protein [Longimicrobiales bacterium]
MVRVPTTVIPGQVLRGAWFSLVHGPARTSLAVSLLCLLAALAALLKGSARFPQLVLLGFSMAGIGMGRRSIGDDRLSARSVLLFQRPVSPMAHYGGRLLLSTGLLALGAAVLAVAAVMVPAPSPLAHAIGGFYWGCLLLIMSTTLSSVTGRFEGELVIAVVVVSALQVTLVQELGLAAARDVLYCALVPVDAIFGTWNQWASGTFAIPPATAAHLLGYPTAWLALLAVRLRRADLGAADYHVN